MCFLLFTLTSITKTLCWDVKLSLGMTLQFKQIFMSNKKEIYENIFEKYYQHNQFVLIFSFFLSYLIARGKKILRHFKPLIETLHANLTFIRI
jgi:hypothetical protein